MSRDNTQVAKASKAQTANLSNNINPFDELFQSLDLPNRPPENYNFVNPNIRKNNPAYCFYSLQVDKFKCLAAINKLSFENNIKLTNETLFYLKVTPDIAYGLNLINDHDYHKLKSRYQDMFETLTEFTKDNKLSVDYDFVNKQIEKLNAKEFKIETISLENKSTQLTR
ncbi:MAG: hypothetical protein ISQ32_00720 [Rickettsiales bacterium]|nr:hypothetical protein [Rickettsiales bacterium]